MLSRNPLGQTHEFRQACHACYSRIGPFQAQRETGSGTRSEELTSRLRVVFPSQVHE